MRRLWMIAVLALAVAGCNKEKAASVAKAGDAPLPMAPGAFMEEQETPAPDTLLVDVDGHKLTYADAQDQVRVRMTSVASRVPKERLPAVRKQVLGGVIEQYVLRTLLLAEADRRQVLVTKADEDKAYDKLRQTLPAGMTLEQVMKTSPIGEEKMKEELKVGIRIDKLLAELQSNEVAITDQELKTFTEENKERLSLPERATARHILIAISPTDDDAAKAAKKEKAEKISKDLAAGGDFAEAARANSDCPSKQKGGDLGTFTRGQMVKSFEDAAFSQEVGAIGPVVETQFGYHIIQVSERKEAGMASPAEVSQALKAQKGQKAIGAVIEGLKAKAKIQYGKGFEPPAGLIPEQ